MNASQGKVLIVDDEPSIRRVIRTTFGTLGFDIAEAVTGEQALPLLRSANFDAVLLDVNMPGMGGLEACREIRRQFPRLSVLMLTVRDTEDDKVEALNAGADDYVTKPFPIRELVARVRAAVRRSHAPADMGMRDHHWRDHARCGSPAGPKERPGSAPHAQRI